MFIYFEVKKTYFFGKEQISGCPAFSLMSIAQLSLLHDEVGYKGSRTKGERRALSSRVPQADLSLLSFFQVSLRIPSPFGRSQEEMIRLMNALLYPTKKFFLKIL